MSKPIKDTKNKRKSRYFDIYILKVLKIISPTHGITSNAKKQLNSILCILANAIYEKCIKILLVSRKKTITIKDITTALKLSFSNTLQNAILKECVESISKYTEMNETDDKSSKHTRIGMIFSPSVSEKFLRNFGLSKALLSENASIYLSTALEYVCAEILTSSVKYIPNKKCRITIKEIALGIKNDTDLHTLCIVHDIHLIGATLISLSECDTEEKLRKSFSMFKEIKEIQNAYNCLFIPKTSFERLVRDYAGKYIDSTKLNKNVVIILQYVIEQYIILLLQKANKLCNYTGRRKLSGDDIKFILSISEPTNTCFCANTTNTNNTNHINNVTDTTITQTEMSLSKSFDSISDVEKE